MYTAIQVGGELGYVDWCAKHRVLGGTLGHALCTICLSVVSAVSTPPFLQNPVGVVLGGTLGHALCTALAVIGGKIIAQKISVRTGVRSGVSECESLNWLFMASIDHS